VEELIPERSLGKSLQWKDGVTDTRYDCSCSSMKSRYYCPNSDGKYPVWLPKSVEEGKCNSPTPSKNKPLPSNFKVLMYGNSHLRQVMETIACMYEGSMKSKRISLITDDTTNYQDPSKYREVPGGEQCRSCRTVANIADEFFEDGCGPTKNTDSGCMCMDSTAQFYFKNGAEMHYTFSGNYENKSIHDALSYHNSTVSDYDAIISNLGNSPSMSVFNTLEMVVDAKLAKVPMFWLSGYSGNGDILEWEEDERATFVESGAHFVPVGDMVLGLDAMTKGAVEGISDPHFCLPGPPDEIGLLLLKMLNSI